MFQLNSDQLDLQRHYDQLSTGRRVLRMSEDPAATGRALELHRGIDHGNQLIRNAQSASGFYQSADNALARVDSALIEARGIAVQAAQTVLSEDERASLSYSIQQTIASVFASGNTMLRDHQMLGGILDGGDAFRYDGDDIIYSGNNAIGRVAIGGDRSSPFNLTGAESLGASSVFLEGDRLQPAMNEASRLLDLRQGTGVSAGVILFGGTGDPLEVDLRAAATIDDVVDIITGVEVDGRSLLASLTTDGIRIEYADGLAGTLTVSDSPGGTMARDLGISNPTGFNPPPLIGSNLSPRATPATKIADLDGGNGVDLSAGLVINQGDQRFVVDLSEAETIDDVLIAINRSGADIRAQLDQVDGRIRFHSLRSGVDYSIGENGGVAARALGIRSATGDTLLSDLGKGSGLALNSQGPELLIERPDGVVLGIDLEAATTVQDVIATIRNHPLNQDTLRVLVDLNQVGNGLQLRVPPGPNPLVVRQPEGSNAGNRLGLIDAGQDQAVGSVIGSTDTIIGSDYAPREAGGTLDTLLRLKRAVYDGDQPEIARLQARLDTDLDQASRARGRVGLWARNADQLKTATQDSVVQLQSHLSDEIDADLPTVINQLSQRQLSLEASMRIIGQMAQLTVLNFL